MNASITLISVKTLNPEVIHECKVQRNKVLYKIHCFHEHKFYDVMI